MSFGQKVGLIFKKLWTGFSKLEISKEFTESETFFVETATGYIPVYDLKLNTQNVSAFRARQTFTGDVGHKVIEPFYCPTCQSRVKLKEAFLITPANPEWENFFDDEGDYHEHWDSKVRQKVQCESGRHSSVIEFWYKKCHCGWTPSNIQLNNPAP